MVWAHSGEPRPQWGLGRRPFRGSQVSGGGLTPTVFRNLGEPKTGGNALAGGVACAMRERRRQWPGVYAYSPAAWGASEKDQRPNERVGSCGAGTDPLRMGAEDANVAADAWEGWRFASFPPANRSQDHNCRNFWITRSEVFAKTKSRRRSLRNHNLEARRRYCIDRRMWRASWSYAALILLVLVLTEPTCPVHTGPPKTSHIRPSQETVSRS